MTPDEQPLIDENALRDLLGSLPEGVRRRIVEVAARDLVELAEAIHDARTMEEARDARHRLLGAAGGVGAVAVCRLIGDPQAERQLVATARATARWLLVQ